MMPLTLSPAGPSRSVSLRGAAPEKGFTLFGNHGGPRHPRPPGRTRDHQRRQDFRPIQVSTAKLFINESMTAPLTTYRIQVGDYPSTAEGLAALITSPADKTDRWHGLHDAKTMPLDPWKHDYKYTYPGTHNKDSYDLWSMGPDGVEGAGDIGNW